MELLTTKLLAPPPRPNLVARARLRERLDAGVRAARRLTLVSAPAGFGKTTLVAQWLAALERPVAWLSLDEAEDDRAHFLEYLVASLQRVEPAIGRAVVEALRSPQAAAPRALLTTLLNDMAAAGPLVLVLDDYHTIASVEVHEVVRVLLERLPSSAHLVVTTREDPPLPLALLRARGQLTEVRERDLRFTADEAAAFLRETMGLSLGAETAAVLAGRTEGWIAGLQLAALAYRAGDEDAEAFARAFAGDDRYVVEYLLAEVLDGQDAATGAFLEQTCVLDRLNGSLCDALTGRSDGREQLAELHQRNLFVVALDRRGEWYRYHRLFADALRARLGRAREADLHERAAAWYETAGLTGEAIRHALLYAADRGDFDAAERLIRASAEAALQEGAVATVRGWLAAVPAERVRADGRLSTWAAWAAAFVGDLGAAEAHAADAESAFGAGAPAEAALLPLVRAAIAIVRHEDSAAAGLAAEALARLPEEPPYWRVVAAWALAEAQERAGPVGAAIEAFRQAERVGRALASRVFAVVIDHSLASALDLSGRRGEAAAVCTEALARCVDADGAPTPAAGLLHARLAELAYEGDELDLAQRHLTTARALCERLPLSAPLALCLGVEAALLATRGEHAAALESLAHARAIAEEGFADAGWVGAWEASLRLSRGEVGAAAAWATASGFSPDDEPMYLRLEEHLAYARLLLAQGRLDDAATWLDRLLAFGRARGFDRWLISVRLLRALLALRRVDRAAAREEIAAAVRLAAPGGYVRAFVEVGPALVDLLREARGVAPGFVRRVLAAIGVAEPRPAGDELLAEPLSEREIEVLALIGAGLSNAQIADRLVIAAGTVKRHLDHIYGKLEVHSRTQAVARARALKLLG
jgi:LuxR family maltose regulon positive regulatory protein